MNFKGRLGFTITTHVLVAILAGLVGFRASRAGVFTLPLADQIPFVSQKARLTNTTPPASMEPVDFSLLWEVWNRLERDYIDPSKLDAQKMVYGAIAGMTSSLGDPYTVFLPPETKQRLNEDLQGEFDGVGIQLGYIDGQLAVITPLKDHPAMAAGVKAGDFILKITDKQKNIEKDAVGMTAEEAVGIIRGKKGTSITMRFLTKGEEPRDIDLVRDTIEIPSVEIKVEENGGKQYAHITLSRFGDKTFDEWEKAVQTIQANKNIDGIIMDMRSNPGGYLQAAIDISSDFFDGGVVVAQQSRTTTQSYTTTRKPRLQNLPVVVLVDKGSASASEIVAGALRDRRNAKLVGEKTFGKGTVQDAQQLNSGAGLNITIGRWLTPSGQSIQKEGLAVDVEAPNKPDTEEDEGLAAAFKAF
jgi:carboxyl-terminal processing protease